MLSHFSETMKTQGPCNCGNRVEKIFRLHFTPCKARAVILLLLLALSLRAPLGAAQGLNPALLLKPATDTWPTYNGDYSGRRFSPLDQINATNIDTLTLAWIFPAHLAAIKSTPLEVNG